MNERSLLCISALLCINWPPRWTSANGLKDVEFPSKPGLRWVGSRSALIPLEELQELRGCSVFGLPAAKAKSC